VVNLLDHRVLREDDFTAEAHLPAGRQAGRKGGLKLWRYHL
jgi:hypothetical protein